MEEKIYFLGVVLDEKEVFEKLGIAEYAVGVMAICPNDNTANPNKYKCCTECGTKLTYEKQIKKGIRNLDEINVFLKNQNSKLESEVINIYAHKKEKRVDYGILLGKNIDRHCDEDAAFTENKTHETQYHPLRSLNLKKEFEEIESELTKIGINKPMKLYLFNKGYDPTDWIC